MPVNLIISMNIFLLARDLNLLKNKLLLNYIICVLNFNSVPLNVFSAPSSSWTHFYVATSFGAIFKLYIYIIIIKEKKCLRQKCYRLSVEAVTL